jgi:hypothetical protein
LVTQSTSIFVFEKDRQKAKLKGLGMQLSRRALAQHAHEALHSSPALQRTNKQKLQQHQEQKNQPKQSKIKIPTFYITVEERFLEHSLTLEDYS